MKRLLLTGFLFFAVLTTAQAQTREVTGTVTSMETGTPLPGVNVVVEGTSRGTATNPEGVYSLTVPEEEGVLVFSFVGFQSEEVEVGDQWVVDVQLAPDVQQLEDVVVVGYGTLQQREVSASVSSLEGEVVQNIPVASMAGRLQGKMAGVRIMQNSGTPGGGISVRVRGPASISASNQPLYVIDGVPMNSGGYTQLGLGGQDFTAVTGISPSQIASIDVLKDAAAAAIYGSRGANGVVLITTKRGRTGAPQIRFDMYVGVQEVANTLDLLSSEEYLEFFDEGAANDGLDPSDFYTPYYNALYEELGLQGSINTDWQEAVFQPAPVSNFNLSMSGGNAQLRYYVAGSYYAQEGIIIGTAYERINARTNLDIEASENFSISLSVGLTHEDNDRIENDGSGTGILGFAVAEQPLLPVRYEGQFIGTSDGLSLANPVALGTFNGVDARTLRALGNVQSEYAFSDALRLTSKLGFDVLNLREHQYQSPRIEGTYAASADGIAKTGYTTGSRYVVDNFLTYDRGFGDEHDLTLTAGASLEFADIESNFVRGEGFNNDYFKYTRNAANIVSGDATRTGSNLFSLFTRANYTLQDRYIFTASFRADGSSRFGPNNKFGYFPAASVGWRVIEEPFMAAVDVISDLKMRASFGLTGNQAIGNFPWQGLFGPANYNDGPGLAPSNFENPDLKWETTREFNVGADLGLFSSRVRLTADYYLRKTTDLLLNRPVTSTSGFTSVFDNVGSMENRGLELSLSTVNLRRASVGGFQWTTRLNVSTNHNEVTQLYNDQPFSGGERDINRVQVGAPIGAFYTLKFTGVDPQTGDAIFEDVNDDGDITSADRQIVGSPHPDLYGGLTNAFTYRGFDLSIFLQFNYGNEIFNAIRIFNDSGGYHTHNHFAFVLDRWQAPGDITDVPRASYYGTSGANVISSRYVENGSYLRIKDVTLGYTLPQALMERLGLQRARVYVSGHNLYTFTEYLGLDPDVNSNGSGAAFQLGTDFYAFPQARSFSAGLSVSL